jgi:hypothetical protein
MIKGRHAKDRQIDKIVIAAIGVTIIPYLKTEKRIYRKNIDLPYNFRLTLIFSAFSGSEIPIVSQSTVFNKLQGNQFINIKYRMLS